MIQRVINRWMLAGVLVLSSLPVLAQREGFGTSSAVSDSELRAVFEPVIQSVRASVVQLESDGQKLALGTIVDEAGYLVSKASELGQHEGFTAYLADGRRFEATLVGVDRQNDMALLKIEAQRLTAVKLVDDEPAMGRWIACVGQEKSPVAVGIVSAKARQIKPPQLVLGLILGEHPKGLQVIVVDKNFGAAEAGIQIGDVLTQVEDKRVIAVDQLISKLQGRMVGDVVQVQVLRGEELQKKAVRLSELMPDPESRSEKMNRMGGSISDRRSGFERVIQHDAELHPDHCGGPMVNLKGQVVGLNIARAGRVETYALPSGLILRKIEAIKAGKQSPSAPAEGAMPVKQDTPEGDAPRQ